MFNSEKNGFINLIRDNQLQPLDFEVADVGSAFKLSFKDTPMFFKATPISGGFLCEYIRFLADFPLDRGKVSNIEGVYDIFQRWLTSHLLGFIEEQASPDLWQQMQKETPSLVSEEMFNSSTEKEEFSSEEKEQIKLSLNQFHLLIKENFSPTEDQLAVIDERIAYLSKGVDRLNKFDWRSILVSSIITIGAALSLNSEQGRLLFTLAKQAFAHIVYLPQ